MTKKKPSKTLSNRRNPLMLGDVPLNFDDYSTEEMLQLTPDQEAERFLSRWMDVFHPYSTFPRVFKTGTKEDSRIFREIKIYYKKYVLNVESDTKNKANKNSLNSDDFVSWSEQKFAMVINTIFENRAVLHPTRFEKFGRMYDMESLPVQVRLKRGGRK